jgi:hypothetical protein
VKIFNKKNKNSISEILHDATALVWGFDLINGKGINPHRVFDLSLIVESIVLHDRLVFISPSERPSTEIFLKYISLLPDEITHIVELDRGYRLDDMIRDIEAINPGYGHEIWMTFPFSLGFNADPVEVVFSTDRPKNINDIENYTSFYLHEGRINRDEEWGKNSYSDFDPLTGAAIHDTTSPYEADDDSEEKKKLEQKTVAAFHIGTVLTRMRYYMLVSNIFDLSYKPDSLRTPFFREMVNRSRLTTVSMGEKILRNLEKGNQDLRKAIANFIDLSEITYRIPIILSTILKKVDTPSQIIEEAIFLRNTKAASNFRTLMKEMSQDLDDSRIDNIKKRIIEIEKVLGKEFTLGSSIDLLSSADMKYSFMEDKLSDGINVSKIAGVGLSSLLKFYKNKKYVLLKNLSKEAKQIKDLNPLLEKVFGNHFSKKDNEFLSFLQESKY